MSAVRTARLGDAAVVAALSDELGYPMSAEAAGARLASLADTEGSAIFVAEGASGGVVAWIHVCVVDRFEGGRFAEIGGLIVAPRARGRGIGRELVAAAVRWARERRCPRLRVRSNTARSGAAEFYGACGFTLAKTQSVLDLTLDEG